MLELGNSLLLKSATRARVRPVVYGFCISVAVCATAFIPVMAFTFLGLTGSPYVRETNPLFAGYIATSGLVTGLFLALVANLLAAAGILALVHLLFYRPVI